MKKIISLISLLAFLTIGYADMDLMADEKKEEGCLRGSKDGAKAAILLEKATSTILDASEPNSKERQRGLDRIKKTMKKRMINTMR